MSEAAATVHRVTASSLIVLLRACEHKGSTVRWEHLPGDLWGIYSRRERTITLHAGMSQGQEAAALLHEIRFRPRAWRQLAWNRSSPSGAR